MRNALSRSLHNFARLVALRNLQEDSCSLNGGNLNLISQSCLGKEDGNAYVQVVTFSLERLMGLHKYANVQVSCSAFSPACVPLSRDLENLVAVHPWRNLHLYFVFSLNPSLSLAYVAGLLWNQSLSFAFL